MSDIQRSTFNNPTIWMWLFMVVIAGYASLPLLDGWSNDPSLAFGIYTFSIWLISVMVHWRFPLDRWAMDRTLYAVFAAGMLFLGILGELQAMVYLAFACMFSLPIVHSIHRILAGCIGLLWTPFWAWGTGPFLGSSAKVVSLVLAVAFFFYSIITRITSHGPKANHPAL